MEKQRVAYMQLQHSKWLLSQHDFKGAVKENNYVLNLFPDTRPGDEALFNMGRIYAHYGNPRKNYRKSLNYFERLVENFPESRYSEEAKTWKGLLEEIEKEKEDHVHFVNGREFIDQKDFEAALAEYQEVHALFPDNPPGDEALFNIGLIFSHYENQQKDYKKSLDYFRRLVKDFPESPLVKEAKVWIGLLEVIEKSKQADIEIEEKKKELAK